MDDCMYLAQLYVDEKWKGREKYDTHEMMYEGCMLMN